MISSSVSYAVRSPKISMGIPSYPAVSLRSKETTIEEETGFVCSQPIFDVDVKYIL